LSAGRRSRPPHGGAPKTSESARPAAPAATLRSLGPTRPPPLGRSHPHARGRRGGSRSRTPAVLGGKCVAEGETGRSRLRPPLHPGPETQRRDARLARRRSAREASGGRVLGEGERRSRSERSSSVAFGQVGRSTSTAVAAAKAWSLSSASPRWADVGVSRGRIDLGRDMRTLIEEAALFGL